MTATGISLLNVAAIVALGAATPLVARAVPRGLVPASCSSSSPG